MMRVNILERFPILIRLRLSMDVNCHGHGHKIVLRCLLPRWRLPYGNGKGRR